ncbi:MAG: hypothetical protein RBG13Loki_0256 [Promethearchaeota archaeon CR_4]|nr:MAG: hypothetical protein RBG13Loki_0256 [Candidatus Lokiarchaeota archaeon CR_4]
MPSSKSKIFVVKTSPKTVLEDYKKLMHLADYQKYYPKDQETLLKLNLSWSKFFPSCSSPPWQVEGVLKTMVDDGYNPRKLFTCENRTVVTNIEKGLIGNRWEPIIKKYGAWFVPLTRIPFVPFKPAKSLLALDSKIFPTGFSIPKFYIGKPIIHLPTFKTHGHTGQEGGDLTQTHGTSKHGGITCAMKNAFGGLLTKRRHFSHKFMSEVLVDLLQIQQQIHPSILAVVDGTVCGDGAGPRTMIPRIKNFLLAGYDQVAVDTVVARMMGFEPLKLPFIRIAHENGLGMGDFDQIEVVGEDVARENWHFHVSRSVVIWGDQAVRKGRLKILEPILYNEFLFNMGPRMLSEIYHDFYWYNTTGRYRIEVFMKTEWGKLFQSYPRELNLKTLNSSQR